jgi:P-type Cu+ transporter
VLADGTGARTVTKVLVANLQLGQLLVVHPGERIPADGVIESGASDVDESMLTGESVAVVRNPGDMVVGGSLNGAGNFQLRVAALGPDATLGRIAAMVEAAAAGTAPVQQLVDKVSAWFVPTVLVIAAATAAGWWLAGADFGTGLIAAVAVLVIACPCALGLATPTAIVAGTGAAARAGILVKNVAAMERANAVQFVYFDKTGTLTHGRPRITAEHFVSGQTTDNCLLLAASVEAASEHPLRHAFAEAAAKRGLATYSVLEFRALAGRGIKARCNGQDIVVGNLRLMHESAIQLEAADEFAPLAPGSSRVFIGCDAMLIGAFDVADELRADAVNTLQRLGAQGIELGILSGDASLVVNATAAELGAKIDAHAEMLPADKAEYLAELRNGGRIVAFVGDGINDAPALASADIGIAIGGATDVAIETADITLLRPEPTLVLAALEISRRTVAKIAQNLFWACGYNVVCIPLAAFGFLSPALAGAAMAASSISVVVNSLALARWRPV